MSPVCVAHSFDKLLRLRSGQALSLCDKGGAPGYPRTDLQFSLEAIPSQRVCVKELDASRGDKLVEQRSMLINVGEGEFKPCSTATECLEISRST